MRLSRLVRGVFSGLGLIVAGVLLFDLAAFLVFPGVVQRIAPEYANDVGVEIWRESREHPYYRPSDTRGFDIAPGARSVAWHPPAVEPYEVWANSLGCFDEEPPENTSPDIYLAGDSFTWGYAPYETKFGTIIERETDLLVYACGVTHTGQGHQFEKFREVSGNFPGWPVLVIVNVVSNDIANDFAFPHSVPVGGGLMDTAFLAEGPDGPEVRHVTVNDTGFAANDLKYYLKTYSATANVVNVFMRDVFSEQALGRRGILELYAPGTYPIREDIAAPHRQAILGWLNHAREKGYQIRFALIPEIGSFGDDIYREFRKFLHEHGGVAWDFEAYVQSRGLPPKDLYWPVDGHFNTAGNAVYAEFLLQRLKEETRAGALGLEASW